MRKILAIGCLVCAFVIGFFYPELVFKVKAPFLAIVCVLAAFWMIIAKARK